MQGLFRNPLADPGLIGVSSGSALAAAALIVMGAVWFPELPRSLGSWPLMGAAFVGGLVTTGLIYGLSQTGGGTRIGVMLLAGVAINALAMAGLGLLSFLSTDEQLRNLQMWLMGSLGSTRWPVAISACGVVAVAAVLAQRLAQPETCSAPSMNGARARARGRVAARAWVQAGAPEQAITRSIGSSARSITPSILGKGVAVSTNSIRQGVTRTAP